MSKTNIVTFVFHMTHISSVSNNCLYRLTNFSVSKYRDLSLEDKALKKIDRYCSYQL